MNDYLKDSSPSTVAITIMEEESQDSKVVDTYYKDKNELYDKI